ncbi:hypothetical protein L5515_010411 [Caenorhabditis briggsae]|uniref:Homeobox domain-containing protein n=1 Tax=Caenorhabditis briggsae TaxID=6238 RepID=A0AAE9ERS1_CAEBR|nr:hypothetical protein L5515_010411 [Caenorhabditis briggsae]
MHSYPSSGSSLPSQLTGPSNFPSIPMNMSLAPQNGPFQPAFRVPVCMSVLQGSHHAYRSQPGSVTMSAVQGSQVHHHHQIGFEQMRRYQHAFHAQAQAYFQWYQQMAAMQSAQIFGPHPLQPFSISPIHTAPHRNPLHQQYSQRSANRRRFNKDQVRILKKHFAKDNKIDRKEIEKLAPIVGLTPAQIRHWFNQERVKVRKYGEKKKEEQEKEKEMVNVKKEIIVVKIECDSD